MSFWTSIRDKLVKPAVKTFLSTNPVTAPFVPLIDKARKSGVVKAVTEEAPNLLGSLRNNYPSPTTLALTSSPAQHGVDLLAKAAAMYNYNGMYPGNTPEQANQNLSQRSNAPMDPNIAAAIVTGKTTMEQAKKDLRGGKRVPTVDSINNSTKTNSGKRRRR